MQTNFYSIFWDPDADQKPCREDENAHHLTLEQHGRDLAT